MAITASQITSSQTLEEFRLEFNKLQNDVTTLASGTMNANLDVSGTLEVSGTYTGGGLMTTGGNIVLPDDGTIGSATLTDLMTFEDQGIIIKGSTTDESDPILEIQSTGSGSYTSPDLVLYRNSASPADADYAGRIDFQANNDAAERTSYGSIWSYMTDVSNGSEDAMLALTAKGGGANYNWYLGYTAPNAFQIPNGGYIGSFGDYDAIHIATAGAVTFSQAVSARKPIKTEFNASGAVTASLTTAESGATVLIHGTENNVINLPAAATTNPGLYYDFIIMTAVASGKSTIVNIAGSGGNFVGALSLAGGTAANAVLDNAGDAFTFVASTVVGSRARITCLTDNGTNGVWQVESVASPIATID